MWSYHINVKDGAVRIATHGGLDNSGSNPSRDVIFQTHLNWPWGPSILQWNWYCLSFPGIKSLGCGGDQPPALVQRFSMSTAILLPPSNACLARYGTAFPFTTAKKVEAKICNIHGKWKYNCNQKTWRGIYAEITEIYWTSDTRKSS